MNPMATVNTADLVDLYQTSGRFHPYTCQCPPPIRDEDPPKAVLAETGLRLRCVRCSWDQSVTDPMLMHVNAVMAMPTPAFGDIFPRCIPDPRPAVSMRTWRDTIISGGIIGALAVAWVVTTFRQPLAGAAGAVLSLAVVWPLVTKSRARSARTFNHG